MPKNLYLNVGTGNESNNWDFPTTWSIFMLAPMMFATLFSIVGFTFLMAGQCRSTNVKSIIAKVSAGAAVTILVWWFWGFGFAFGETKLNLWDFGWHDGWDRMPETFYYLLVLCLMCTVIISGAVTDRMRMWPYVLLIASVAGGSFPLVVNWVVTPHSEPFNSSAWLRDRGVIDTCGAGFIHVIAGVVGTVAAHHLGPREGRFISKDGKKVIVNALPYDALSATAGTWILVFCFFNYIALCSLQEFGISKTTYAYPNDDDDPYLNFTVNEHTGYWYPAFHSIINAAIAMAASAFFSTLLLCLVRGQAAYSLPLLNNATLGGLVGITAACMNADTIGSFFIGIGSGILAYFGPNVLIALGVDDPRDVFTVHFLQGSWALLSTGLWARHMRRREAGLFNTDDSYHRKSGTDDDASWVWTKGPDGHPLQEGAFYSGNGILLGYQMVYLSVTIIVTSLITLFALHLSQHINKLFFSHLFPAGSNSNSNNSEADNEEVSCDFPYLSSSSEDIVPDFKVINHLLGRTAVAKAAAPSSSLELAEAKNDI